MSDAPSLEPQIPQPTLDLLQFPTTDPTFIYRYRDGLYAADLLTAAISHLDFFAWLNDHPSDLSTICRSLAFCERPTDVMLTLFTRSEEHTSELQSHSFISYAVFCLKKKTKQGIQ